jgi:hypothetical protein
MQSLKVQREEVTSAVNAGKTETETAKSADSASSAGTQNTTQMQEATKSGAAETAEKTVPYDRFKEVNDARRAAEARLKAIEDKQAEEQAARAKAEQADAEKRGEFEKLYKSERERVEALVKERDELAAYRTIFEEDLKKRREGLPEHIQELLAGMTPLAQAEYLRKHGDKLKANPAPNLNGGERGSGKGGSSVEVAPVRF